MTDKKNELTNSKIIEEDKNNLSIRPKKLSQFIGQSSLKSNLKTFIESSL